ncbi:MAG: hypothetical protein ACRD9L_28010, partial [Bryobacteraceae bacterium]
MKANQIFVCVAAVLASGLQAQTAIVAGRIVDEESGGIVPATVALRTSAGSVLTENPGFATGFRSGGEFEKSVPAGSTSVT